MDTVDNANTKPVHRLEVFTGAGRRRTWSDEDKARIVAEILASGDSVSAVARRHGLSPQQLLCGLFVAGALAVIRYAEIHGTKHRPWLTALLARRPTKVAAIALANKIARMVWAMMARGERYKEPVALAR
jgi:hypothetical protein